MSFHEEHDKEGASHVVAPSKSKNSMPSEEL